MENYNLTAELKKIASGITTSDPNTELGNINSGVGNLDTAMQGVATAINGISIPNPGSNIDGVATAINNKTIPDPSSNIDGVANAINNKTIPDPTTALGNIATAINNLTLFSYKFYFEYTYDYTTNGTWGNYSNVLVTFDDLPHDAYGPGKTFMLIHNVSCHQPVECTIESKISLYGMAGTVYINLSATKIFTSGWPTMTHISFVQCDSNPRFNIGVCSNAALKAIYSNYILVPLN